MLQRECSRINADSRRSAPGSPTISNHPRPSALQSCIISGKRDIILPCESKVRPLFEAKRAEGDTLGEVRLMVKITNSADLSLVHGKLLSTKEVRSLEADAMVDTGAVSLVLPSLVVERLGLARRFRQVVEYADGRREEVD